MIARVLLIDDDDIAREFLAELLRDAGLEVFQLPSPIGATRTILSQGIDAVVLDVCMPDMDGDKSAKVLRENGRLNSLAIILVSSLELPQLEEVAARVKADAVVCKVDARTTLVPTVRAAMRWRAKSTAADAAANSRKLRG